jgi:uncharacterized protein YdaU (DUF1376 family)
MVFYNPKTTHGRNRNKNRATLAGSLRSSRLKIKESRKDNAGARQAKCRSGRKQHHKGLPFDIDNKHDALDKEQAIMLLEMSGVQMDGTMERMFDEA